MSARRTPPDAGSAARTDPAERDAWAVLAGVYGPRAGRLRASCSSGIGSGVAILREASSPGGPDAAGRGRGGGPRPAGRGARDALAPALATAIAEAAERAAATLERIRELGLTVVTIEDPAYPARLGAIEMPPHLLYVLGDPRR